MSKTKRKPLPIAGDAPVQTSAPSSGEYVHELPIKLVRPSPSNPRKSFDETHLKELADSIREVGVLQPILVRPIDGGSAKFEVVAGERRFRACKLLGLDAIPATVRQLDDRQVIEIQLVENLQRQDVNAIEEAEGFRALVDQADYTVEHLAERLGKSRTYVYAALKMLSCPKRLLDAVRAGECPPSLAQLVGRLPSEDLREQATAEIWRPEADEWMTFRNAKELIEEYFTRELKAAPFDPNDDALTIAGSCKRCPKRTGNARELFPDGRADICTDTECFAAKVAAHGKRSADAARAAGRTVLDAKQADRVFADYGDQTRMRYDSPYHDLDEKCHEANGCELKSWREQLPKGTYEGLVVVAIDAAGRAHELVPKREALEILRDAGKAPPAAKMPTAKARPDDKAFKIEQRLTVEAVVAAVENRIGKAFNYLGGSITFLTRLSALLVPEFWSQHVTATRNRRKIDPERRTNLVSTDDMMPQVALALVAELVVHANLDGPERAQFRDKNDAAVFREMLLDLGIDQKKIRAEAKAQAKETE